MIEAFSEEPEHHLDLFGVCFEVVQGRAFARREGLVTGLATELANGTSLVNPAIADQGIDIGIGDAEVITTGLGAGEAGGINRFLAAAAAFALGPGHD